jgi:hypothetical protein
MTRQAVDRTQLAQESFCEVEGRVCRVFDRAWRQKEKAMLFGSCLCQGVAFEIDGTVVDLVYCHCAMCRKAHASAFRARGKINAAEFRWTRGEELVRYFESSPGNHRGFCSVCGSSLVSRFDQKPAELGLALGILDVDPVNRPVCHVYVASKAPWHEIADALPQFDELPPGYSEPRKPAPG